MKEQIINTITNDYFYIIVKETTTEIELHNYIYNHNITVYYNIGYSTTGNISTFDNELISLLNELVFYDSKRIDNLVILNGSVAFVKDEPKLTIIALKTEKYGNIIVKEWKSDNIKTTLQIDDKIAVIGYLKQNSYIDRAGNSVSQGGQIIALQIDKNCQYSLNKVLLMSILNKTP